MLKTTCTSGLAWNILLFSALVLPGIDRARADICAGDCDRDGRVRVDELILGVDVALGLAPASRCAAFDADASGNVTIDELLRGVGFSLGSCSLAVTPTPTATPTPSPTFAGVGRLIPEGIEFQINVSTDKNEECPSVAAAAGGGFVVTWEKGFTLSDVSFADIFARRFDGAGRALGAELQINTYTLGAGEPQVAADPAGGFLVVWRDVIKLTIFGRAYDAAGDARGSDVPVKSFGSFPPDPKVAAGAPSRFVVVWSDRDDTGYRIAGQRLDGDGHQIGSEFQVNTSTVGNQIVGSIIGRDGGGFLIAWTGGASEDRDGYDVFAQRLDADAERIGAELQVNSYVRGDQNRPAAAFLSGGGFVVTWTSEAQDGSDRGVFAQRFDSAGERAGTELQVNAYTPADQSGAVPLPSRDGGFLVAWESEEGSQNRPTQDASEGGIFAQRFDSSGSRVGSEFQVNTYTLGDQGPLAATRTGTGDFALVWEGSSEDGAGQGVFGQRLRIAP